jgi:hypothetical protein
MIRFITKYYAKICGFTKCTLWLCVFYSCENNTHESEKSENFQIYDTTRIHELNNEIDGLFNLPREQPN